MVKGMLMRIAVGVCVLLSLVVGQARAADLHRGINITNWFRFPVKSDTASLAAYMSDMALDDLRRAGFDFVRLAVDPSWAPPSAIVSAVRRIERHGLSVIVAAHPNTWHPETSAEDRAALLTFWIGLSAALRSLPIGQTLPELVNEPVFPHDPAAWGRLQHALLVAVRRNLPASTIVLTGQDWGSIGGLLDLAPEDDPNVVYSIHFYDPAELTSLAAYRADVDHDALRRLPFPVVGACPDIGADAQTAALARYYCQLGWDRAALAERFDRAAGWAAAHHATLLLGEFGATAALPETTRAGWITAVRSIAEERGIPWALWGYDDVMGFNISHPPPSRPSLSPLLLTALGLAALQRHAPH
jgi:endoglucanase